MKKFLPIIIIIALVAVIICFAACGNDTADDTVTSISNELTTMMDDLTSVPDTSVTDMTDDTTDLSDVTDNPGDITADENGMVTAE